jgi:hypothetical protein
VFLFTSFVNLPVQIDNVLLRRVAKLKAAYQKSLNPRLLVPVGLGVLIGIANNVIYYFNVTVCYSTCCFVWDHMCAHVCAYLVCCIKQQAQQLAGA